MVTLLDKGDYRLIETKSQHKILTLKEHVYAWIMAEDIGEILITSHKVHHADHILARGKYRLYDVASDYRFTDLIHLELLVGEGQWQSYLLPTGLPDNYKLRSRIIPTSECISRPRSSFNTM